LDKLLTYFFIAVALGADAFSLALGLGMGGPSRRAVLRTSFTVGIFHIFMPLAGLLVGSVLGVMAGRVATWIGGVILVILGFKMIWEGRPWRREVYSFRTARKALEKPGNVFSWGGILVLRRCNLTVGSKIKRESTSASTKSLIKVEYFVPSNFTVSNLKTLT
jgi:hypothetical protein